MANAWLRFCYCGPIHVQDMKEPCYMLRALRNDGQQFVEYIFSQGTNVSAIHRELRLMIEKYIDEPAMPPSIDDETGVPYSNQISPDSFLGDPGWQEAL